MIRWRIRHKLLLGLGLVAGFIALLLIGTLQGMSSFISTMKASDSKLAELSEADEFDRAVAALLYPGDNSETPDDEERRLQSKLALARERLAAYEVRLRDSVSRNRDPDRGEHEGAVVKQIQLAFDAFENGLKKAKNKSVMRNDGESLRFVEIPAVASSGKKLCQLANELRLAISDDLYRGIAEAKHQYQRSMIVVITTSVFGIGMMAGLLNFFYRWVFHPLRDLQNGVNRVASGDFQHRITLNSGDELEELAAAFNAMTGRLSTTYTDLATQISDRSKQLVRSEQMASVGFLAAGVAHEINNPLASIAFCGEALERRLGDLLAQLPKEQEAVAKYLRMIQQEAFRCKAITQNLLEFSRVGEGERKPTDLAGVIQSVLEMAQHLPNCQGKKIIFRPAARIVAQVNAAEVKQVVLNLVVNALDSMDENGVLTITQAPVDNRVELVFSDTGCGMTNDILPNIFEPFFTRSRTGKGTGLGLSICQRIINQHGGEIEATSAGTGQGSTFMVRLPLPVAVPAAKEDTFARAA